MSPLLKASQSRRAGVGVVPLPTRMTSLCGYQLFSRGSSSTMADSKCINVVRLMFRPTSPAIPHPPTAVVSGDAAADRHCVGEFQKGKEWTRPGASLRWFLPSLRLMIWPTHPTKLRTCKTAHASSHGMTPRACPDEERIFVTAHVRLT